MHIAIAGGGIAGVAAALALSGRGHRIKVFERAPEPREVGAGIQLSPNAMRVLDRLGVSPCLAGKVVEPRALYVHEGGSGDCLTAIPLSDCRSRYGAPYSLVHRADLLSALIESAASRPDVDIQFGSVVSAAAGEPGGVRFAVNEEPRSADILIAADGIRSSTRTGSLHLPGPISVGRVAWRASLDRADVPSSITTDGTGLWLGSRAHLVHYPVSGGSTLNVIFIATGHSETGDLPLGGFARPVQELAERIGSRWMLWPLERTRETSRWSAGRICLIGDAAHAMAPSAAQGGAQAIEDAFALGEAVRLNPDPTKALEAFATSRRPRVSRVAREGMRNLAIYEMRGPAALARNLVIRSLSPTAHLRRLDWLYGGGPAKIT